MLKIGITGGIGSGKSVICHVFNLLGIAIYYADDEAKKLYTTDAELKAAVITLFGSAIYDQDIFQAHKLAQIVFESNEKLEQLNQLVHPKVNAHFETWCSYQKSTYVIKEAALLIESTSYKSMNEVVLVSAPIETRIARVMKRDFTNREAILQRIDKQSTDEAKRLICQYEIINDGIQQIIPQVMDLHHHFLKQAEFIRP